MRFSKCKLNESSPLSPAFLRCDTLILYGQCGTSVSGTLRNCQKCARAKNAQRIRFRSWRHNFTRSCVAYEGFKHWPCLDGLSPSSNLVWTWQLCAFLLDHSDFAIGKVMRTLLTVCKTSPLALSRSPFLFYCWGVVKGFAKAINLLSFVFKMSKFMSLEWNVSFFFVQKKIHIFLLQKDRVLKSAETNKLLEMLEKKLWKCQGVSIKWGNRIHCWCCVQALSAKKMGVICEHCTPGKTVVKVQYTGNVHSMQALCTLCMCGKTAEWRSV